MKDAYIIVNGDDGEVLSVHDEQQPYDETVMQYKTAEVLELYVYNLVGKMMIIELFEDGRIREEVSKHE